jgi:hypothetical protein
MTIKLMKKTVFSIAIFLGHMIAGYAQSGEVIVNQDSGLTKLLELYKRGNTDAKVYTIQVGFGSYAEAKKLKDEFVLEYPDWPVTLVFDSPTYRVQAGRFHNRLDAEREFMEVRKKFPGSLLLRPGNRQ